MSLAMSEQLANQRPGLGQGGIWISATHPPNAPPLMNLLFLHQWEDCPLQMKH